MSLLYKHDKCPVSKTTIKYSVCTHQQNWPVPPKEWICMKNKLAMEIIIGFKGEKLFSTLVDRICRPTYVVYDVCTL